MKKNNYKEIVLCLILTLLTGSGILLNEYYDNKVLELCMEIDNKVEYILNIEKEVNRLKEEKNTMTNSILELESDIEKLEKSVESLEKKVSQLQTTSNNAKAKGTLLTFEATAYANDPITATGTVPAVGRTIAVDPKVIPLGSKVYIEGMGTFTAEDNGGAIKGNIIDIYMGSEQECRNWGRRKVQLRVL